MFWPLITKLFASFDRNFVVGNETVNLICRQTDALPFFFPLIELVLIAYIYITGSLNHP